jgi:predicted DNA-binding transcriptional regulator YafY
MTQRLGRIVRIIVMLQAGVRCNALRIAAEAGVHRRTVFRDFAALRSLGFPVSFDAATGCYFLPRGSMPASDKGLAEFLSLFQDDATGGLAGTVHEEASQAQPNRSDELTQLVWQDLLASEKLFPELLAPLMSAVQSQHRVMVVQSRGAANERQITLQVNELTFGQSGWSLHGTGESGEPVHLAIDLISECIEADPAEHPTPRQYDK